MSPSSPYLLSKISDIGMDILLYPCTMFTASSVTDTACLSVMDRTMTTTRTMARTGSAHGVNSMSVANCMTAAKASVAANTPMAM